MADAKLTALTAASALAAADLFYVSQSAASRKATGTQLLTLVGTTYVPLAGGTMTGALTLPAGAVGAPSLLFTGAGATTGFYSTGSDNVSLAVGGNQLFYCNTNTLWIAGATGAGLLGDNSLFYFGGSSDTILRRDGAAATLAQRNGTNAQTLRIYGTADGSPGANYQRMVLSANGTTGVTIAAEGLGTPTANQDITLTPGGTGRLNLGANAYVDSYGLLAINSTLVCVNAWLGANSSVDYYNTGFASSSSAFFAWTDGARSGTIDTAFKRNAAGVVEVNNGAAGTWRDMKLRNLIQTEYSQLTEMTAPAAPATNSVRIYAEDNGAGKTRLMALFATGAAQQISIEP